MLKIAKSQRDALESAFANNYARDVAGYLRAEHADAVKSLSDAELLRRATIGIARAESYGITWDSEITAFVAMMFEVSPTFDEQPAIARVLGDPRLAPDVRIDALWDRTSDEDWDEAERSAANAEMFWNSAAR